MTTLRTYYDCVQYFKGKVEKQGFRFDFIDNPYTGSQFVVINGYRAKVAGCGAATPIRDIYQAIKNACNEAWSKITPA